MTPSPVFLPKEFHGQRSVVGCCPWGCTESAMPEATQHACMHWRRQWQPTPVFLPGESQGQRRVAQSWTLLKQLSSSSKVFDICFNFN